MKKSDLRVVKVRTVLRNCTELNHRAQSPLSNKCVTKLKADGLDSMTNDVLREVLSSAKIAKQKYPDVSQDIWQGIIEGMIKTARERNHAVGILLEWEDNR